MDAEFQVHPQALCPLPIVIRTLWPGKQTQQEMPSIKRDRCSSTGMKQLPTDFGHCPGQLYPDKRGLEVAALPSFPSW